MPCGSTGAGSWPAALAVAVAVAVAAWLCLLVPGCKSETADPQGASATPSTAPAPKSSAAATADDSGLPTVSITTASGKTIPVQVELAISVPERTKGLMFRKSMADDRGMLFFMGHETIQTFWMKNTLIPLDMLFLDPEGVIVGIVENAVPQTLDPRRVDAPSSYVLEVNGGWCAARGVHPGDRVDLEPAIRAARRNGTARGN